MTTMLAAPSSRNVTLGQLTVFLTAADTQSFSAAAVKLGVSQPTLSRNIGDMESALGYALFNRTSQGVSLSARGEVFLERGRRLLAAHSDAQVALASWRAHQKGRVKLVGSSSVLQLLLPKLMRVLQQSYGCAYMEAEDATCALARQRVLDGNAALGVFADFERHHELHYTLALQAQLGLLVSPHFAVPDSFKSLNDLASISAPILRFGDNSPITLLLRHHDIGFDSYFSSPIRVSCEVSSLDLVQQGLAVAVSSGIEASHVQAAGLRFIPLPGLLPTREVYVAIRHDALIEPVQESLRKLLIESIHQTRWHSSVRLVQATHHVVPTPSLSTPTFKYAAVPRVPMQVQHVDIA